MKTIITIIARTLIVGLSLMGAIVCFILADIAYDEASAWYWLASIIACLTFITIALWAGFELGADNESAPEAHTRTSGKVSGTAAA